MTPADQTALLITISSVLVVIFLVGGILGSLEEFFDWLFR